MYRNQDSVKNNQSAKDHDDPEDFYWEISNVKAKKKRTPLLRARIETSVIPGANCTINTLQTSGPLYQTLTTQSWHLSCLNSQEVTILDTDPYRLIILTDWSSNKSFKVNQGCIPGFQRSQINTAVGNIGLSYSLESITYSRMILIASQ